MFFRIRLLLSLQELLQPHSCRTRVSSQHLMQKSALKHWVPFTLQIQVSFIDLIHWTPQALTHYKGTESNTWEGPGPLINGLWKAQSHSPQVNNIILTYHLYLCKKPEFTKSQHFPSGELKMLLGYSVVIQNLSSSRGLMYFFPLNFKNY